MDEINDSTWFEFELTSKTQEKPQQPGQKPTEKTQPVLEAISEYANEKIVIVGSPGAGKSTLLARVIGDAAQQALNNPELPIPVLVELKLYRESEIWVLIQTALETHNLYLEIPDIKRLVADKRLLLLADGFNELPTELAKYEFQKFCQREIPIIVTTRDFADDVGIERKLQLQNLDSSKVKAFFQSRLPGQDQKQIQQLCDRVKDFGQTPLMVWMLFSIFQQNGEIPATRGEAYRVFTTLYAEKAKQGIDLDESRSCLSKLAFAMMQEQKVTDFRLKIGEFEAQDLLGAKRLKHLWKYHLLQATGIPGDRQIRFCHQSLQEYYAAEWLLYELRQHPEWLKKKSEQKCTWFQQQYLNLLKWTESLAIMLSLMEDEDKARRVVEQALDVDLILGARLAGVVKPNIQKNTVNTIARQQVPEWFRVFLLGETKSPHAADELMKAIKHPDPNTRRTVVWRATKLNSEVAMPVISNAITDPDPFVRETAIRALGELNTEEAISLVAQILLKEPVTLVQDIAVLVLGKSESEAAIRELLRVTQDTNHHGSIMAVYYLEKMNREKLIYILTKYSNKINTDVSLRKSAIDLLGKLGDKRVISDLFAAQLDLNENIYYQASSALAKVINRVNTKNSDATERQEEQRKDEINEINKINIWRRYLNSTESTARGNAVFHLTSLLDKEIAVNLAVQFLDDPHHYVRGHALNNLVRLIGKEAIPQAISALDDPHPDVLNHAAQALRSLKEYLPNNFKITEETVDRLIRVLTEAQDNYDRSQAVRTLTNLCSIQPSLILDERLEIALFNASYDSDPDLRSEIARGLEKFNNEKAASRLLQMLADLPSIEALTAIESLKNMSYQITAKYLPDLIKLILNSTESFALDALFCIQNHCQFYNYEIFQLPPVLDRGSQSKQTTNIFNIETLNAKNSALNLGGTIHGNQIANQNHKSEL